MKTAIWCRHKGDNVIGIGPKIPWHVKSDFKRFKRITEGSTILAGEITYESFPNKTLPNRKIIVLSFNEKYEVSDKENHRVLTDAKQIINTAEDIYIAGGASIYKLFMQDQNIMPDVIIDSEYQKDLDTSFEGKKVDISPCIDVMKSKYTKISKDYLLDDVITSVWIKDERLKNKPLIANIISEIEKDY